MDKAKEELYIDYNELEAYRDLNGEPFDFGDGEVKPECYCGEDVYWKREQWEIESMLDDLDYCMKAENNSRRTKRANSYKRKQIDKRKLQKLRDADCCFMPWDENIKYKKILFKQP